MSDLDSAPAPTHQQTVAALRHFSAIERELSTILADPDVGRADVKSKVIDGTARLVARQIITPAHAEMQLATFPEKPFEQRQWLEAHFAQAIQGADAAIDKYRMATPGIEAPATPAKTARPTISAHWPVSPLATRS